MKPPPGAWDCHTHVFGPPDRFPPQVPSAYALPEAPTEAHRRAMVAAGIDNAVAVQPAPYAQDVSALLDALDGYGGRLTGVGSARAEATDGALEAMHAAGVRALRFVEARTPAGERYAGSVELLELAKLAPRMAERGWHAETWAAIDDILAFWPQVEALGVPLVLDHMGGFDARRGLADPAFQRLVALVREGRVWVKLTLCRRAPFGSDYSELRPFHDALIAANPERMVWGSDWPFVRMGEHAPTIPRLLDLFGAWVTDEALRRRILVENPARLYRSKEGA
jgi:predicted TIM-barrel fold metal-dependent hydrolase